MLTHTEYTAKFATTICGRDYRAGDTVDDPKIPPYVLSRLVANRRLALSITPTTAEPVAATAEPAEASPPPEAAEYPEPAQDALSTAGKEYLSGWKSAHYHWKKATGSDETFRDFLTRAAAESGVQSDGTTNGMLAALQERGVIPT